MDFLGILFSSKVRARILELLMNHDVEVHVRELVRQSGLAIRTVQQDLKKLMELEVLKSRRDGNRLYYSANRDHPIFEDLRRLVQKSSGWVTILKDSLREAKGIQFAFVFGSMAKQEEKAQSDLDIVVIGDVSLRTTVSLLRPVSQQIQREINPHVFTLDEFRKRLQKKDRFLLEILSKEKIFVIGSEDELRTVG